MADTLVIVESPAKAKTIAKYLGKGYKVRASVGHVVDLPRKTLGVDIEHDFQPTYEVMPEKKKVAAELKQAAQGIREIILAPDPDREGEAIAWHIADLLAGKDRHIQRILINEITQAGVKQALAQAGELNRDLFDAQQARRILDRLVGYQISPLLYKKVRKGLSAGRVQSVAVRLVVDRENAIRSFKSREYWSVEAELSSDTPPAFKARLIELEGKKVETGPVEPGDPRKTYLPNEAAARAVVAAVERERWVVRSVDKKDRLRHPPPPFITSQLQQEASKKLRFPAKRTMGLAQRLYEGVELGDEGAVGLITYMRTDSTRVSKEAQEAARRHIVTAFGPEFLPAKPNVFASKKGAQDAHEAVRPTDIARAPESVKPFLDEPLFRLYELIYLRFLASQMKPAVLAQTAVDIPIQNYLFRATGSVVKFKGFLAAYQEGKEEDEEGNGEARLPDLAPGQELKLLQMLPEQHFTQPPPRFTEASLVKELEERGIGRPSTYASILGTIQDREYVTKEKNRFWPTPLGEMITAIMIKSFPEIMDYRFTAQMEEDLDRIEDGKLSWQKLLHRFYPPFAEQLRHAAEVIAEIKTDIPTDLACPKCGKELVIKWGRNGEFLGCSGYPECDYTSEFSRGENGEVKIVKPERTDLQCPSCGKPMLIKQSKRGEFLGCSGYPECKQTLEFRRTEDGKIEVMQPEPAEATCDLCGKPMVVKKGRYGPFLACTGYPECRNIKNLKGEARKSVHPKTPPEPAPEGEPPCEKCGKPMVIRQGKWGPFLSCSGYPRCKNIRRQGKAEKGEELKAPEPAAAKKSRRGAASKPRDAGFQPAEGEPPCEKCGQPMVVKQSRFGSFLGCSGYPKCKNIRRWGKGKPEEESQAAKPAPSRKTAQTKNPPAPAAGEPPCEKCGKPMVWRKGRFGPFLGCSGYPQCRNIRKSKKAPTSQ